MVSSGVFLSLSFVIHKSRSVPFQLRSFWQNDIIIIFTYSKMAKKIKLIDEKAIFCFATKLRSIRVRCKTEQFYISDYEELFTGRNS